LKKEKEAEIAVHELLQANKSRICFNLFQQCPENEIQSRYQREKHFS